MKQNLQIKTFLGCSENAVKSQIYVAMICYLLLELIRRIYIKGKCTFSNFCEKIRLCISYYQDFNYITSHLKPIVHKKTKGPPQKDIFKEGNICYQTEISFPNLTKSCFSD